MTTCVSQPCGRESSVSRNGKLMVALPEPSSSMTQDAEWCVVRVNGDWRQIRFHDYDQVYAVPGLYERLFYDILGCDSPRVVRELLETELSASGTPARQLRTLDLGAGNGIVGEELADMGAEFLVGVDIIEEAAEATERDRPGLYENYHVLDIMDLNEGERRELAAYDFNALTCVAALGFGDIPTKAFTTAFNLVRPGGWIAFNIKEDFLTNGDRSGFSRLIRSMMEDGVLKVRQRRRYQHRFSTDRKPLYYEAIVGVKTRDV